MALHTYFYIVILLHVEQVLSSGESPKIIKLNFRQWDRNDYSM